MTFTPIPSGPIMALHAKLADSGLIAESMYIGDDAEYGSLVECGMAVMSPELMEMINDHKLEGGPDLFQLFSEAEVRSICNWLMKCIDRLQAANIRIEGMEGLAKVREICLEGTPDCLKNTTSRRADVAERLAAEQRAVQADTLRPDEIIAGSEAVKKSDELNERNLGEAIIALAEADAEWEVANDSRQEWLECVLKLLEDTERRVVIVESDSLVAAVERTHERTHFTRPCTLKIYAWQKPDIIDLRTNK